MYNQLKILFPFALQNLANFVHSQMIYIQKVCNLADMEQSILPKFHVIFLNPSFYVFSLSPLELKGF